MRSVAPLFIALSALMAYNTGHTASNDLRIATFNIAMGLQEEGHHLVDVSDHRLVWLDISL